MAMQFWNMDLQKLGMLMKRARESVNRKRKAEGQPEITQREIAKLLKVRTPTVSDWEQGKKHPGFLNVLKYCEVLEISPDELLGIHKQRLLNISLTEEERDTVLTMLHECQQETEFSRFHAKIQNLEHYLNVLLGRAHPISKV